MENETPANRTSKLELVKLASMSGQVGEDAILVFKLNKMSELMRSVVKRKIKQVKKK